MRWAAISSAPRAWGVLWATLGALPPPPPPRARAPARVITHRYTALAALSGPVLLPDLAEKGLRWQLFANAGSLVDGHGASGLGTIRRLLADTRASVGIGLVWAPPGFARIELNHTWVARKLDGDLDRRIQVGLSIGN